EADDRFFRGGPGVSGALSARIVAVGLHRSGRCATSDQGYRANPIAFEAPSRDAHRSSMLGVLVEGARRLDSPARPPVRASRIPDHRLWDGDLRRLCWWRG